MSLPVTDGLEIASRHLGASGVGSSGLGCGLLLACRFQLFRQSGGWGGTSTDEARATSIGIVGLDHELLRRGLSMGNVALLAGVGALTLAVNGRGAHG